MPKTKPKPLHITTREGARVITAEVVAAQLTRTECLAELEQRIASLRAQYDGALDALGREIEAKTAALEVWAATHPEEFTGDAKSIEFPTATIGFRLTPPRCEKIRSKDTWDAIALRALEVWGDETPYLRIPAPTLNKEALLNDRTVLTADELRKVGITFAQQEMFFLTPKSDVVASLTSVSA